MTIMMTNTVIGLTTMTRIMTITAQMNGWNNERLIKKIEFILINELKEEKTRFLRIIHFLSKKKFGFCFWKVFLKFEIGHKKNVHFSFSQKVLTDEKFCLHK
jgi:hypothetical protein